MDEMKLKQLIEQLREWGVIFDKGLTSSEIKAIESECKFRFPEDLRIFLQLALPIWQPNYEDHGPYISEMFPNWRTRGAMIIRISQRWLLKGLLILVNNQYKELWPKGAWLEVWGPKPPTMEEAFTIVKRAFKAAPILVPVFVYHFIPSEPTNAGNPVFTVLGTDIIYYAPNLTDYLLSQFGQQKLSWNSTPLRPIRFWGDFISQPKREPPEPPNLRDVYVTLNEE